jgi:hypothetical protein
VVAIAVHSVKVVVDEFLDILAHGDDAAVTARIYDAEYLSTSSRQVPLGLLRKLHAPAPGWKLEVVERHPGDGFELLVLRIPWLVNSGEPDSGLHPLIVAEQGGALRAVGFVLPWNEVIPRLGPEMSKVMSLAMIWIGRVNFGSP